MAQCLQCLEQKMRVLATKKLPREYFQPQGSHQIKPEFMKQRRIEQWHNENPGQTVQEVIVVFFSWIQKDILVHFIFYTLCVRLKALQLGF